MNGPTFACVHVCVASDETIDFNYTYIGLYTLLSYMASTVSDTGGLSRARVRSTGVGVPHRTGQTGNGRNTYTINTRRE